MRLKGQNWYLDVEGHGKLWFDSQMDAIDGKDDLRQDYPGITIEGPTQAPPKPKRKTPAQIRDQVYRDLGMRKVKGNLGGTYYE